MLPIKRMIDRVELGKEDSDTTFFLDLMNLGEFLLKLTTVGMLAAVIDGRDRLQYSMQYKLVRANGVGDWANALDEIIAGPTSHNLIINAQTEQNEINQRATGDMWQHEAVTYLNNALLHVVDDLEPLPGKIKLLRWFHLFALLRNKTVGHGATKPSTCSKIVGDLEEAILSIVNNFSLFKREWAYLHQNKSHKYRVTHLSDEKESFYYLKTNRKKSVKFDDGVYIYYDEPVNVNLLVSDQDANDFYLPNGGFSKNKFELLSYITDGKKQLDSKNFKIPPYKLPKSETCGMDNLEVKNETFTNIPDIPEGYIDRVELEVELHRRVMDDRHPIITVVGRGGIGKTSTTLKVLNSITKENRFDAILWFSARDIDLLPEGAKKVSPDVLSEEEISKECVRLLNPEYLKLKKYDYLKFFSNALEKSPTDAPLLFVFDNFETVKVPVELFAWIDTYIRNPNKVLITTRYREFKGDYPVEVFGMTENESSELIDTTSKKLSISDLVSTSYKAEIIRDSDGHPYVIKILLGEAAKERKAIKVRRMVASKDGILEALFERTFGQLSPAAKRVFLTLCSWRSNVPQIAVEAVLLRSSSENYDVEDAIEDLVNASFIERISADDEAILNVPLAASEFGRKKLSVSPYKTAVELDSKLLQLLGASRESDSEAVAKRVDNLFKQMFIHVVYEKKPIDQYVDILKYIAKRFPRAWIYIYRLYLRSNTVTAYDRAKYALSKFLEEVNNDEDRHYGWNLMYSACEESKDINGAIHALVEISSLPSLSLYDVSDSVKRAILLFKNHKISFDKYEVEAIVGKLMKNLQKYNKSFTGTDCSRLSWLYLLLHDKKNAQTVCERGLALDPDNTFCLKLKKKLGF